MPWPSTPASHMRLLPDGLLEEALTHWRLLAVGDVVEIKAQRLRSRDLGLREGGPDVLAGHHHRSAARSARGLVADRVDAAIGHRSARNQRTTGSHARRNHH